MDSRCAVLAYPRPHDAIASRESADERIALRVSISTGSWRPVLAACLSVGLLAACSGEAPPQTVTPVLSVSTSIPTSMSVVPVPIPSPDAPTSSAAPKPAPKPKPAEPVQGSCGTVTAASGLTLQVLNGAGVACADATRIVDAFHKRIAGRQSAGSDEPVSDTVDGWLCVSGAPAAQGGTSCSKGEQNVFAAVVPVE